MMSEVKEMQHLVKKHEHLQDQVEQINHNHHQQPVVSPALIQIVTYLPPQPLITIPQLLEILESTNPFDQPATIQYHYNTILDTVTTTDQLILALGANLSPVHQELVAVLMQRPKFQSWFKSRHSSILTITSLPHTTISSAHYDEGAVSPLSYMCRLLSLTLSQNGLPTPLVFYCTEHCTGPLEGAGGCEYISRLRRTISENRKVSP
jgi:hypothetical protein